MTKLPDLTVTSDNAAGIDTNGNDVTVTLCFRWTVMSNGQNIGASVANDFKDFSAILVGWGEQEREAGHEKAASSESLPHC